MPFLHMLPMTFPSRITEIICDQQEKQKYRIHQNKTNVKRKEETQMGMGWLLLFLSEETKPDNRENHGVLSLLSWHLSFRYLPPFHQITMIHLPQDIPSPPLYSVVTLPKHIHI